MNLEGGKRERVGACQEDGEPMFGRTNLNIIFIIILKNSFEKGI